MTATRDRRAFPRRPALENRTSLEWWEGSATRTSEARVLDVSQAGTLLSVDRPPPVGHRVWLRMESPASTSWVGGEVVRIDDSGHVGIRLLGPGARDFDQAAVLGITFGNILGGKGSGEV